MVATDPRPIPKRLGVRQHFLLCEALRRRLRFNDHGEAITEQWTGLGSASAYEPVVDAGLMECATQPNPRYDTWWRLTERGASIVQAWIDQGVTYEDIEADRLPERQVAD